MRNIVLWLPFCFLPSLVFANDLYLDANIASHHFCEASCPQVNNERNYGLGLTYQLSEHTEIKGGFYKNSYSKNSTYVLSNWYNQWTISPDWHLRAGIGVGIVSGYYNTGGYQKSLSFAEHKLQVGALPFVALGYKHVQLSVGILGEAMTFQVQYQIH